MSTKPQSAATPTTAAKQPRSRKAANPDASVAGRAGSAGGVVLEKQAPAKLSTTATTTKAAKPTPEDAKDAQPKRKPRKLNKEPTSTPATTKEAPSTEAAELEALKSRVRGLEAKVEELYKSAPLNGAPPRSPRRRGKGRKSSSATTTATLGNLAKEKEASQAQLQVTDLDSEDADEELVRLEDELEHARQDLALYRPQANNNNTTSSTSSRHRPRREDDTDPIEEIPRPTDRPTAQDNRQITLSGSYRIPLPSTLNPEDVKTIQSGVTAAQNVARSFLDQRRANAALRAARVDAGPPPPATASANNNSSSGNSNAKQSKARARDSGVEMGVESEAAVATAGGKQSWGEWIGGYSLAISRAVKSIEHEAAMEAQRRPASASASASAGSSSGGAKKKKRPAAPKTTLSGEQIEGLMG